MPSKKERNDIRKLTFRGVMVKNPVYMAEYMLKKFKKDVLVEKPDPLFVYLYDEDQVIWERKEYTCFETKVNDFIVEKVEGSEESSFKDLDEATAFKKSKKSVTTTKYMKETAKLLINKIYNYWNSKKNENPIKKLNAAHDYLPVKNNMVVNLKTGETKKRKREHYFTTICEVELLDETVKLKNAKRFIMDICCDDKDLFKYLVTYLGYCLTGRTEDRSFAQFYGKGLNGKSVLMEILQLILGPTFFKTGDRSILIASSLSNKNPTSSNLIDLIFARIVGINESNDDTKLDAALIKGLTSGDEQSVRQLYGTQQQIKLWGKILLSTNKTLGFDVTDQAIIDRLRLFACKQRFEHNPKKNQKKADPEFVNLLKTEYLDEVFTLLVRKGSVKWYKKMIGSFSNPPKVIRGALEKYIKSQDPLGAFIEENLVEDPNGSFDRVMFYNRYKKWYSEGNYGRCESRNKVYEKLESKGFVETNNISRGKNKGYAGYKGYKFDEETNDEA